MKIIKYSLICLGLITGTSSCDKDEYDPQLVEHRPAIPVIVTNSTELRPSFTVRSSRATGTFNFDLEIPASSGRTIKEISKIIAATGPAGLLSAAAGYIDAPIAGSGNKVSFASTLTTWASKTGRTVPANNALNAVELPLQFYVKITLDDNSQLITEPLRVLVVP